MQCPKPDCMYLHELGDEAASFTKEEMQVMLINHYFFIHAWRIIRIKRLNVDSFVSRRENIKNMSRNSSKTSIKLILAFYNLHPVEQRSLRVNQT